MPTIILTHQQLYDRVLMTPLDALAKELGLSGRGLGKLCNRHDIPVPPRGWWAKKAPGHRVRQTPLPAPSAGLAASIGFTVPDKVEAEQSEAPQLHPLVAFEQQSKNGIDVPDDLTLSDPVVLRTQRLLNKGKRDTGGLIPVPAGGLHVHTPKSSTIVPRRVLQAILTAFEHS